MKKNNFKSVYSTANILYRTTMDPNDFEDIAFSEAHKYTDNLYSCRVKFTHILKLGQRTYKDYFDKYVYIEKVGNSLKVIDMQTPAK